MGREFPRKRSILSEHAAMACISGPQGGFAARGFGTGFFSTAARIGVLCNSFGACGFGLFQSLPRRGESGFGLRHLLSRCRLFRIRNSARLRGVSIRTQRRMGFTRAAEPCFGSGQFGFRRL